MDVIFGAIIFLFIVAGCAIFGKIVEFFVLGLFRSGSDQRPEDNS